MFCPACKTEYREGFTTCADCGAELLAARPVDPTTDETGFKARPTAAVWRGTEERKAIRMQEALLRAGLPAEIIRQGASALEVRVPVWTADAVAGILSEALTPPGSQPAVQTPDARDALLECPLCWNDYSPPVRFCPNCAVELRDLEKVDPAVTAWEGDHPGDAYRIHQALLPSGIPFYVSGSERHISHVLLPRTPLQPHRYSLKVLAGDEAQARAIVEGLELSNHSEVDVLPPDAPFEPDPFSREEEPEIAWTLVWSGANVEALEALRFVFRENEIRTQVSDAQSPHGQKQLHVPAPDEQRARAIVRQILEGEVPPELENPEGSESTSPAT